MPSLVTKEETGIANAGTAESVKRRACGTMAFVKI
jgi:hypothetical protein